ncbi:dihydrolipoamide acetyltransferase family protein [Pseudohongiella spirulinae]|uniref:Dihydrolipoamide acetyltransferase component of pyruvate dehydrogenase complex n=1 Tax=Pseudohongiella spirulinae TaxID=1249552 RepID=A0A0S2KBH3_9GAMM|nr:dihydrolipoamide acetyltransferase family protein [Pseudohongiella spirulinae]ALO45509.1 Putative dihydrolipoamide acetyltransferase [Pseudohongiella spirulinae]
MKYFKLPDLGEGLQDAEIVEWHIKAGEQVTEDQIILSVETAKAIVELPAPQAGTVLKLFGEPGDIVHVGDPLLEYDAEQDDSGTVVGEVSSASRDSTAEDDDFIIGSPYDTDAPEPQGRSNDLFEGGQTLKGVQRVMAKNMSKAHAEVVSVSIHDDVDINAWKKGEDPTMRLVRAIAIACQAEPGLNAWYDGERMAVKRHEHIDLGIAVDTPEGLFVPVLRNIAGRDPKDLRKGLNALREAVQTRKIPPQEMRGATITLSNFGTMAGRYANPVIVPPMVAILGAGKIRLEAVATEDGIAAHRVMPLSLSFDHRSVSGGEAARFLAAVIKDLGS